ncbi:response regulator [Algibacter amylolyticus]|uniref:dolichyl-phosphate beta-glucosyltransferase n=1 Tax=Algibacter amylolyticus TaxID=1608400 RepID=A0A5M7B498_9FLAO|nr:response regulator [Algibacter amylolyticus]KAA5822324.1 response regulator [Algibacter amylolyticus]MBB5269040.1 CheY-like chemotaxis protein/glycosyltransferase involved in cell wall biosynthesis [Algibacter amylolyticus]TSJ73474.1 response regulator [Algibacter amylolyticus]
MKILAIDDQQLVLLPLQKRLQELGYEVIIETDAYAGISIYNHENPDLVIVDINMPNVSGLDIVKYIRNSKNADTPVMVLSGNTADDIITTGFELGINDYMKKPLSLNEISARVKRLIGAPAGENTVSNSNVMIQERCVGVVIPCYNEEERLLSNEFITYIVKNSGYHLCFVNDGSTDRTLEVLKELQKGREDFITVYNCKKNGGKAEAVRLGMLHMAKKEDLDYIGFLDADLSTDLADFDDLVKTIETSDFKIVSGSRISRMGANITKESARKIISLTINYIIRKILKMDFKDTQCGAKIFHKDVINIAFGEKFVTQWIFDVEIFKRMSIYFGLKNAKSMLCEQPLKRWIHADGSKLSMKDSVKIVGQLAQIAWVYRAKKYKMKSVVGNELKMI